MTTFTLALNRGAGRLTSAFEAVTGFIGDFFAGISDAQEMARRYEELSRMSDAGLAARGIRREDIVRLAVHGRLDR